MTKEALIQALSNEISKDEGTLVEWSKNYLRTHTKRYFHDLKLLEQYYRKGQILEVGCSPYHLTYLLQQKGYPVTGLDILPER